MWKMNSNGSAAVAERPTSVTDLMGDINGLYEAISELELAWYAFQYGDLPPSTAPTEAMPSNRIEFMEMAMREQTIRIGRVIAEMRSRS